VLQLPGTQSPRVPAAGLQHGITEGTCCASCRVVLADERKAQHVLGVCSSRCNHCSCLRFSACLMHVLCLLHFHQGSTLSQVVRAVGAVQCMTESAGVVLTASK
jgi:hypothetical protein